MTVPTGFPPQQHVAEPGFTPEQFFTQAGSLGGGGGAPSFHFDQIGSGLLGLVVSQTVRAKTQPGSPVQEFYRNGKRMWQLNVVLQTDLRNWQGIKTPPTKDDGSPVPPSEDTGLRQIYLWYTLREAVEKAMAAVGATMITVGWELGVKVVNTMPNPKGGNAIKEYVAIYRPASGAVQTSMPAVAAAPTAPDPFVMQQPGPAAALQQALATGQPTFAPVQQYAPPVQQAVAPAFAPVQPVQQYAPPVQQYAPPVQQAVAPPF